MDIRYKNFKKILQADGANVSKKGKYITIVPNWRGNKYYSAWEIIKNAYFKSGLLDSPEDFDWLTALYYWSEEKKDELGILNINFLSMLNDNSFIYRVVYKAKF